jgi:hypothetical protein
MERHFVDTAKGSVYYPYFKKAHFNCTMNAIDLDGFALENLIRDCWAKVEWGFGRILVRDGANAGWINYMLKDRQSEFDGFVDCIIIESLHSPIADA